MYLRKKKIINQQLKLKQGYTVVIMSLSSLRDSTSKYKTDVICSEPRGYVKLCWLTILKIKKLTHIYILKYMHSYNQLRVEAQ